MDIEKVLKEIEDKHFNHTFSEADAAILCDLVAQHSCHLAAQLRLIEDALRFWRFFPQSWRVYYQAAIEQGSECWTPQELADIYLLGALLYSYDQDRPLQQEAVAKAFELAPHKWRAIIAYLAHFGDELPAEACLELIERISQSNPDHPRAYYVQASYFEEYAAQSGDSRYWASAIRAYQKFIEMAEKIRQSVPIRVAEEAIQRLSEKLDHGSNRGNENLQ